MKSLVSEQCGDSSHIKEVDIVRNLVTSVALFLNVVLVVNYFEKKVILPLKLLK